MFVFTNKSCHMSAYTSRGHRDVISQWPRTSSNCLQPPDVMWQFFDVMWLAKS